MLNPIVIGAAAEVKRQTALGRALGSHTDIWRHRHINGILPPCHPLSSGIANQEKHGIGITEAQNAFLDRRRILAQDLNRSTSKEARYYCYGSYGGGILTVRFTYRGGIIRMFGAGYWSKGKRIYEQENQVHEGPRRSCKDR